MTDSQKNSFDLLRLLAAVLVLYSHQHVLLGLPEPRLLSWTTLGGVGVSIFFVLSGFLVWTSWHQDPDLKRFFIRRSLRIFPVLWFVVLFSVLVLGSILSVLSVSGYFASSQSWGYFSTAMLVIRHGLPGVFADNPYPFAVNDSQIMADLGTPRGWSFSTQLYLSFGVTSGLAYLSWHLLEKRVLVFKPKRRLLA